MSSGHRHGSASTESELAKQYRARTYTRVRRCTVNIDYDVPWLANRSKDGKTVYIDRHIPTTLPKTGINITKTFPFHELG